MVKEIFCLADDTTGGLDVAGSFFSQKYNASVILDGNAQDQLSASCTVRCLNSRHMPFEQSRLLLKESLAQINSNSQPTVYLKVDSALRGNMLDDSEELARNFGNSHVFIAPAFPHYGRICIDGIYYIDGIPVNESELAGNTAFHHTSAYLNEKRPGIHHIDRQMLDEGYGTLFKFVTGMDEQMVSFDTRDEKDLALIAQLGVDAGAVMVGSSGLARAFPKGSAAQHIQESAHNLPSLHVVGSLHSMARRQLRALEESGIQGINMRIEDVENESAEKQHQSRVRDVISRGGSIYISSPESYTPDSYASVESSLGRISSFTDPDHHLIIVGGETARAVLKARNITEVQITGEFEPGIPISKAATSNGKIYTKAGAFGQADTLAKICRSKSP